MNRTVARLRALWCRITNRHKVVIDYDAYEKEAPWLCDRCGEVVG